MRCGKSALLIQKAFQFNAAGRRVVVLKPSTDTRSGEGVVESRIGISWPCITVSPDTNIFKLLLGRKMVFDVLLVDEINFLTTTQINQIAHVVQGTGCMCLAFGLKCDFEGKLFDASKRLFELADRFDEMPSMCDCGSKATKHFRVSGEIAQFVVGDEIYRSVCRGCFIKLRGTYE
jgi:thymidine kinase